MGARTASLACIVIMAMEPRIASSQTDSVRTEAPHGAWTGVILATRSIDLVAEVEAQVESLNVGMGDRVAKGTLLATLDDTFVAGELDVANANLLAARARMQLAVTEEENARQRKQRRTAVSDAWSKEELADAELAEARAANQREIHEAEVASQEAVVRQLQARLGKTRLTSPFAAVVVGAYQDPGAFVEVGMPIVRLISADDLRVRFAVPEPMAARVSVGDVVVVEVPAIMAELSGEISRIAPEIDSSTQTIVVEASVTRPDPANDRLRSGMLARVRPASRP